MFRSQSATEPLVLAILFKRELQKMYRGQNSNDYNYRGRGEFRDKNILSLTAAPHSNANPDGVVGFGESTNHW